MRYFRKKLNTVALILLAGFLIFLSGCFTYTAKAQAITIDESTIPTEVTVDDFNLSDIKIIVDKIDGSTEVISVTKDMLSDEALEKLTKSGTHYVYIRYYGNLALATITLLDNYPSVTVTFVTNGGTAIQRQIIEKNSLVLVPENPVKNGYKFDGWYIDRALTLPFDFTIEVRNNLTLYAKWEAIKNIVTYDTNGGSSVAEGAFITGEEIVLPADPTKEGYTFNGWYTDKELTKKYVKGAVNSSFTLYAGWTANDCTIKFEENGGSEIGDIVVLYNDTIELSKEPIRFGYVLEGWYTDKELTKKFDLSTPVKGDMTLYAKWVDAIYTIKFETNGGTLIDDITLQHEELLPDSISTTKENYKFGGWYLDKELATPFDTSVGVTASVTLYAKWVGIVCHITFEEDGGTEVSDLDVNYGQIIIKPTNPTKDGFIFGGWFTDSELTKIYNFSNVVRSDLTLYAKWVVDSNVKPKHTVTLYDGTFNLFRTIEVTEGDLLTNLPTPTMEGLSFEGWYLDQSFESKYDLTIPVTIDLKLYANFVETYIVTFVSKDNRTLKVVEVMGGYSVEAPPAPEITGYDFIGWNHALTNVTESFTAYPLYELHKYVAVFKVGETVISTQYVPRGDVPASPASVYEHETTGYHFAGWDKNLGAIYQDMVYVAKFEKNVYTVEYVDYFGKVYHTDRYYHGDKITKPDFDGNNYITLKGWFTDKDFVTRYQFNNAISSNVTVYGRFDFVSGISYVINGNEITITNLSLTNIVNAEIPNYLNDKIVTRVEKISNHNKVRTIKILSNLQSLDVNELSNIPNLEVINVSGNPIYSSSNGILYKGDTLVLYPCCKKGTDVKLNVVEVGEYAFRNNQNIIRLTLNYATNIKANAFKGSNIKHITLGALATKAATSFTEYDSNLVILVQASDYATYLTNWADMAGRIYSTDQVYNNFLYKENGGNIEIVEYLGTDARIKIPEKINTKNVTKIYPYAFNTIRSVRGIEITQYVTDLGVNALSGLSLNYLIINANLTIDAGYLLELKTMLNDSNVYIKDSEFANYSFTHQYRLSAIDGDFAYCEENNKYGILEYFGLASDVVVPTTHNTHTIDFIKKGFISNDIATVTLDSMVIIEEGTIGENTLVLVDDAIYEEYKAKYPTLNIYPKTIVINQNSDYVYGVYNDEAVIISIITTSSNITIPDTLGGHVVTSIGKYALSKNNRVTKIRINNTIEFIDLYALRSADSNNVLEIIFSRLVAPEVGGEICYLTDKIYKESENLREYGARFPNHTVSVYEAVVSENTEYRYSVSGKFVTILKYLGDKSEVVIPKTIDGKEVIRIASFAFSGKNVTKVTIPTNIIYLEYLALGGVLTLEEVIIETNNVIDLETQLTDSTAVIRVNEDIIHRYIYSEAWAREEVVSLTEEITQSGDTWYYLDSDGNAVIIRMDEDINKLTLDNDVDGHTIVRLAPYALYECDVNNLVLSSDIALIGYYALPKNLDTLTIKNMAAPLLEKQAKKCEVTITDEYKASMGSGYDGYDVTGLNEVSGVSGDFSYNILDGVCTITKYNGNSENVEIPSVLGSQAVRVIGKNAFKDNTTIKQVTFPSSLKTIEAGAFSGCTNLDTVNLGGGLTYIAYDAFDGTKYLNYNGNKLIIIDKVLYKYQSQYDSTGEVVIDSTISSIAPRAFYNATSITRVVIPSSVNQIGEEAFSGCTNITSITLPNSVRYISKYAFSGCTRLNSVTFGTKVEGIAEGAFSGCTYLDTINLDELTILDYIEKYAFSNCESLTSVTLPSNLLVLDVDAFYQCTGLEVIELSNDNYVIENGVLFDKAKTTVYGDMLKHIERVVTLPNTITLISREAFKDSRVSKVIINSDPMIQIDAFKDNPRLSEIVFLGHKLPIITKDSIDDSISLYIRTDLLVGVKADEVLSQFRVRGIIYYIFDTYTIKVGSSFTTLPNIVVDYNSSDLSFRTMNDHVLGLVNGEYVGLSVGSVQFIAYLMLDELQTVQITINVVK